MMPAEARLNRALEACRPVNTPIDAIRRHLDCSRPGADPSPTAAVDHMPLRNQSAERLGCTPVEPLAVHTKRQRIEPDWRTIPIPDVVHESVLSRVPAPLTAAPMRVPAGVVRTLRIPRRCVAGSVQHGVRVQQPVLDAPALDVPHRLEMPPDRLPLQGSVVIPESVPAPTQGCQGASPF